MALFRKVIQVIKKSFEYDLLDVKVYLISLKKLRNSTTVTTNVYECT